MNDIRAEEYFAIVPEWVILADISGNAVRLYALLNRFANSSGRAWPSRRTLSEMLRTSMATIDRAKDELVGVGALTVEHRKNPAGDPSSNLYTLHVRPYGKTAPSSHMRKGTPTVGGTGTLTGDALNRANRKQSQTPASAPVKQCSHCLGKNRDIDTHPGLSSVWVAKATFGDDPETATSVGIYVICPKCDGTGVAA